MYPLPGVLVFTLSFDENRVAVPKGVLPFRKGEKRWTKERRDENNKENKQASN